MITIIVWFTGILGAFEAMHPVFLIVYWGGLILGAVPVVYGLRWIVTTAFNQLSDAMQALVIAAGFSVAYTPVVFLATLLATRFGLSSMVPVWMLWAGTFLAAACAATVRALLIAQDELAGVTIPQDNPDGPRLLQRIDADLRGPLVSISVRDHYVDVRTAAGTASLLLRLSDAIAETDGVDGAQVHRSHWVAWQAVQGVDRRGSNLVLRMAHGEPIPVSRTQREKLEARGLI